MPFGNKVTYIFRLPKICYKKKYQAKNTKHKNFAEYHENAGDVNLVLSSSKLYIS